MFPVTKGPLTECLLYLHHFQVWSEGALLESRPAVVGHLQIGFVKKCQAQISGIGHQVKMPKLNVL